MAEGGEEDETLHRELALVRWNFYGSVFRLIRLFLRRFSRVQFSDVHGWSLVVDHELLAERLEALLHAAHDGGGLVRVRGNAEEPVELALEDDRGGLERLIRQPLTVQHVCDEDSVLVRDFFLGRGFRDANVLL